MSPQFPSPYFSQNRVKNKASFFGFSVENYERLLHAKSEDFWRKLGEKRALELFHQAAERVPAYRDFLKKNKIKAQQVKTIQDFSLVPPTDKIHYIQAYSLAARCWDGAVSRNALIASSSGTTGKPQYWPRSGYQEFEAAITHELLFKQLYNIHRYRTLIIVGFPMGVYVSGLATTIPAWLLAQKYQASIIATGNNKTEVIKAVQTLGQDFEQIIIIGHPFFIKDCLESGAKQGINWKDLRVQMMFCSEGFSEEWREYILREAGLVSTAAFNSYGSSEMLLMAYETPASVTARKFLAAHPGVAKGLLGTSEVPNFFQYNPALRYIEEEQGELLFTSPSGLPLIRFNLHDAGKIISHQQVIVSSQPHGKSSWNLPFLALWGRSDYTIIFYAANIYPQHIHAALGRKDIIKKITGKFTMRKDYNKRMDEFLEIHIELRQGVAATPLFANHIRQAVIDTLLEINSEYNFLFHNLHKDLKPKIKLWPYQHPKFFTPGLKPRYIAAS